MLEESFGVSSLTHNFAGATRTLAYGYDEVNRRKYVQRDGGTGDGFVYDNNAQITKFYHNGTLSGGEILNGILTSYGAARWGGIRGQAKNLDKCAGVSSRGVSSLILSCRAEDFLLRRTHPAALGRRAVIETIEMEETMDEIEAQLMGERGAMRLRLPVCGFHTDEDLAVLESDYVGRTGDSHEAMVQCAHPPIGNEDDIDFFQAR